jgi:hypothetical protein
MPLKGMTQESPPTVVNRPLKPYKAEDIDLEHLSSLAEAKLGIKPFEFQLEIAAAILRGEDVIADIGTGGGKTLCFILPILLSEHDLTIIVSPLNALMIDQVCPIANPRFYKVLIYVQAKTSKVPTIAVCGETLGELGSENVYMVRNYHFSWSCCSPG